MRTSGLGILAFTAAICACASSSSPSTTTSSVNGKLATNTFAVAATGVDAIDEKGARTHVALGADGSFHLTLEKGHTYRLVVISPSGEEPIVFPRSASKLDRTFHVSSGAAIAELGLVRHLDRAPVQGFTMTKSASGGDGECVDGKDAKTGAACADDDAKASCEHGGDASDGDGECVDGKDAKTGAACTDEGDDDETADATKPMAVPEHNPPNDVSGCNEGDDGEENDD